jgi:D-amino-acid dehydrogenase
MHVIILGAGVVGITSAYYLARAGHQVTVLERQPGSGLETSFANAGQVSPGYSAPWAAPGIPVKALKWLMMRHRPLVLWPRLEPRLYGWLTRMLAKPVTKPPDPDALPKALKVVADAKEVSHPDTCPRP